MIYLIYDHMFELAGPSMLGESEPPVLQMYDIVWKSYHTFEVPGPNFNEYHMAKYLGLRRLENVRPGCLNGMTYYF